MRSTSRRRWGRWSLLTSVAMFALLLVPFAGPASANHGSRVLDVVPDTASRGIGASHTLTAKLCEVGALPNPDTSEDPDSANCTPSNATFATGPINIDFEFEDLDPLGSPSSNDPDGGTTFQTPDKTCSIAAGQSTCTVTYSGTTSGDDQIRAWIDHDGSDGTTEADTVEQQDERAVPGSSPAPPVCQVPGPGEEDCTDVVTASWAAGEPAYLDCDDQNGPNREQETNPGGGPQGNETYTCSAYDAQGNLTGDADAGTSGNQTITVKGENECNPPAPNDTNCDPNGINDPDNPDSTSYMTFDYECNIASSGGSFGRCTITVTQGELETGTAPICFYIGPVDQAQTLCANEPTMEGTETDGSDEFRTPANGGDLADRVEKTWEARRASGLDAEPETATNTTGENHTITATVYDQFGNAFSGTTQVKFEFFAGSPSDPPGDGNSPGTTDRTCTTANTSSCSITYTSTTPGRDLVCVWIEGFPGMLGNNQNGTCPVEGRDDPDDAAGSADAPEPRDDDIDVVAKTWQNENPATELNCEPETSTTERTEDRVITCTATNEDGGVGGTNIDVEATGANDPDNTNSPAPNPDFTCTTGNDGTCQVTHNGSPNNELGDTTYRAWIDEDYHNQSNESDQTEGQNEDNAGGGRDEPDNTDVVRTTWVADPERTITLNSNRSSQQEGKRVRFFGDIEGDPNCEDAETVRLRRKVRRGFKTIATTVTDNNGGYSFRIVVRRTATYKAVAPATTTPDRCDKAKSNAVRVTVNG